MDKEDIVPTFSPMAMKKTADVKTMPIIKITINILFLIKSPTILLNEIFLRYSQHKLNEFLFLIHTFAAFLINDKQYMDAK